MTRTPSRRFATLLRRELQEYRVSLVVTPLVIALLLSLLMLVSVFTADRITVMGDTFLKVITSQHEGRGPVISIQIEDDGLSPPAPRPPGSAPDASEYEVVMEDDSALPEEEWNFSREWRFEARKRGKAEYETREVGGLNPILQVMHSFMLIVLVLVTANYLLGCLYTDRKDRSILFWKSMPVSEWEEVLSRFLVALVVAPAIYIAISLLMQSVFVLLAMLLLWRMDMDAGQTVLDNLDIAPLLVQQLGGWLLAALWIAPAYGWLLLASAFARRSPFLLAIAPVIGLVIAEGIMLGSNHVLTAVANHTPHFVQDGSLQGFYLNRLNWAQIDYFDLIGGLAFAAATIAVAVYLRRYRFEI